MIPHLETLGIFHAILFPCAFICINTHIYVEWICNKIGLCYTQSLIDLSFIPGPDFCHLGFQKARFLRDMITHASQHLVVIKSSHLLEE